MILARCVPIFAHVPLFVLELEASIGTQQFTSVDICLEGFRNSDLVGKKI